MDVIVTNFQGDPNAPCSFCNKPQRAHFVDVGSLDGQRYAHHHPCDEQMKSLGLAAAPRKRTVRRFLRHLFPPKAA